MKILVLQDFLRCGGTESNSVFISQFLQTAGEDVHLLTFRPGGALTTRLNGGAVKHTALQPFDMYLDFVAPRLTRTVSNERPDVVLCMGQMANIYGGLLPDRLPEATVIGTMRAGKELSSMTLRCLKRMGAVITNTEWWRRRLIELGLPANRVAAVHNGLTRIWDCKNLEKTRSATRIRLCAGASTVVFVNVSAFRPGKRHELLLELLARIRPEIDWQLWLVGEGRRWRFIQRRAQRLGIDDRVRFIGFCNDPFEYYAGADIAVSTSVSDALPNFIVEANHMGLPAVATDVRGVSEIIKDGHTGFLVGPDSHDDFVRRLRMLIENPRLRFETGQRAAEFANVNFARETQAQAFLEMIVAYRCRVPRGH